MVIPLSDIDLHIFNKNDDAFIKWDVINQKDNVVKYEVERSLNGNYFQSIGVLTPNSKHSYQYYDQQISSLVADQFVFYRIKESSNDNTNIYSETKSLNLYALSDITVFPIPCYDQLTVNTFSKINYSGSIIVKDISGKLLLTKNFKFQKGNNVINIDISNLPKGTYLLFIDNSLNYLKKFVKM